MTLPSRVDGFASTRLTSELTSVNFHFLLQHDRFPYILNRLRLFCVVPIIPSGLIVTRMGQFILILSLPDLTRDTVLEMEYTNQWIALKDHSQFFHMRWLSGYSYVSDTKPCAGDILHLRDSSGLSSMLAIMSESKHAPSYLRLHTSAIITWFDRFLLDIKDRRTGKLGTIYFLKMAFFAPELPILFQYEMAFFYINLDKVRRILPKMKKHSTSWMATTLGRCRPAAWHCSSCPLGVTTSETGLFMCRSLHHTSLYGSLQELYDCRVLCYEMLTQEVVEDRYRQYGGIAHYVFWEPSQPPFVDIDARNCIHAVHDLCLEWPHCRTCYCTSLLTKNVHFQHLVLASRYVGALLFHQVLGGDVGYASGVAAWR